MLPLDDQQTAARAQFEDLRDRICAAFEAIEAEAGSEARFAYLPWDRVDPSGEPGGGGVRGVMAGLVFEKVGVNVSTVGGTFEGEFARTIKGAGDDPRFFATGISLVAHMSNPHVPAVHLNLRFLRTTTQWFGGGADLNPPIPRAADTADFHAAMKAACDRHDPAWYPRFTQTAEHYFFIPHRGVHRGVGGIFYDHLELPVADGLALAADVGAAFLAAYPAIVRARADEPFTAADLLTRDRWRGRYAEFNLVHDRGTLFGLRTGGNIDAILMSLPPVARWD
ncbi:oxygen-dependent coproporphyrinogen oxidase [Sphingomonas bacterium]|uniref:oxygen-dependent coproporphyrinogen oxidase n=1 Tax=Sphingomonas bacterium TaxID=1895847 RepID=UPI001575C731|nr:oxygen-dependent coproporphyrinogen oxidase [Sphingomonas bacterium]